MEIYVSFHSLQSSQAMPCHFQPSKFKEFSITVHPLPSYTRHRYPAGFTKFCKLVTAHGKKKTKTKTKTTKKEKKTKQNKKGNKNKKSLHKSRISKADYCWVWPNLDAIDNFENSPYKITNIPWKFCVALPSCIYILKIWDNLWQMRTIFYLTHKWYIRKICSCTNTYELGQSYWWCATFTKIITYKYKKTCPIIIMYWHNGMNRNKAGIFFLIDLLKYTLKVC